MIKKLLRCMLAAVLTLSFAPTLGYADELDPVVDPEPAVDTVVDPDAILDNYDPAAAIAYSERYVFNYNPSYFNCNPIGGDCANFVSQCLYAGGIPMIELPEAGWRNKNMWYSDTDVDTWSKDFTSATWINCVYLYKYFSQWGNVEICKNTTKGRKAAKKQVWPGSIVLYSNASGKVWRHAAICVGYAKDGTPLVSCHNSDRYHVRWDYIGGYSAAKICIIQLTDEAPTSGIVREGTKRWQQDLQAADVEKTYKQTALKKKARTFSAKALALGDAKVTYSVVSGNSRLKLDTKTGKVTVRKNTAAGSYAITIKAKAAKSVSYRAASKTYVVTVTVTEPPAPEPDPEPTPVPEPEPDPVAPVTQ